jgi:eukaryotic-like serine/threonine-protein kinase
MGLTPGIRLGPYEILAPLGAGAMGEVYRARDPRLGREVAIKVLPAALSEDPGRLRRFEREAKAVSALNHPNILTIHDIGTSEGKPYVVTELLEGETLRERLAGGPLPAARAVELATELAHGLAAAHEKGIVHRDIKPENLFATSQGRLKILDFGLAWMADSSQTLTSQATTTGGTEPGTLLGTVAYMSPEQVRGKPADSRSDLFSAGVVLYELLAGERPFRGETAPDTLTSILRDEPEPLSRVSPALERLVRRCLEKSSDRRFQHARDLAFALESLTGEDTRPRAERRSRPEHPRSVAVLLFKDLAGDPSNAHIGLGLADATITELASIRSLVVRPTASVLRYRDRPTDPEAAGRELGVDAVVDGSFQRSGSRLRVTVQLVLASDGRSLWGTKIDTSLEDVFRMQDEVSRKIAEALEVELAPAKDRPGAGGGRASAKAYELYLQGRFHLSLDTTLSSVNDAIERFEQALALDPDFVFAQLGLADAFARMDFSIDPEGGWFDRAEAMCRRALTIAPELPEGHYLRARLLWHPRSGWDGPGAVREFSAAIAGRPSLNEAHHFRAQVFNHLGLLEEAVAGFDRALAIDPGDEYARVHRPLSRYLQGRFGEALEAMLPLASANPTAWSLYTTALCQLRLSRIGDAAATIERLARQFAGNVLLFAGKALLAALQGEPDRAREQVALVDRNRKLYGHYHHAQYDAGCAEALLGDKDAAIGWLTAAAENGFPCAPAFSSDRWLEPLRGEPRFQGLLADLLRKGEEYRSLLF